MNLAVDIGNTRIKAALFEQGQLLKVHHALTEKELLNLVQEASPNYTILSSVKEENHLIKAEIERFSQLFVLKSGMSLPFQNLYETPDTLGVDRIAAVSGALALYPKTACLVIDLGTCITLDFIDAKARYWGGNISPGLQMRFEAMHKFTDKLPYIQDYLHNTGEISYTGKSTRGAMLSGVIYGMVHEIEGAVRFYHQKTGNFNTILTGGDALFFETKIKEPIFVTQNLTLIGLNGILQYYVGKSV